MIVGAVQTHGDSVNVRRVPVDPRRLLYLFIFSICMTVWVPFSIDFGGLNLRASQLLLPFVLLALLSRPPAWKVSIWSLSSLACGVAWWIALAAWTLVGAPVLGHPFGRVALMALNLLQGLAIYVLVVRVGDLRAPIRAFLWSVAAMNMLLFGISIAATLGVPLPAGWLSLETAPLLVDGQLVAGVVRRFVFGGVLAGCVSAAAAVLAVVLWFDARWHDRRLLWLSGATGVLGMLLGFSRQSIVSLFAGLLVVAPFLLGRGRAKKMLKLAAWTVVALVFSIGILLATPDGRVYVSAFAGRASQFVDPQAYATGTALGRTSMWLGMWRDVMHNPFVGQGQDAYLRYMNPGDEGAHNFALEVLHSTGLLGFLPYVVLHALAPLLALAFLVMGRVPLDLRLPLIGVLGAYVAIWSASLTNLIYWNPLYWFFLALMIAAVRVVERAGRHSLRPTGTER